MLKDFFNFLKKEKKLENEKYKEKELNVTLAGYFNKVCMMFLNKKQREFMEYVFGNEDIIEMLVENVGVRSIAEVLQKILSFENSDGESFIVKCNSFVLIYQCNYYLNRNKEKILPIS